MIADPMSGSGPHGETAEVVMRRAVVLTIDGVDPDAEVPVELSRRVLVDSPTAWAVLTGVTYPTITAPFAHPPASPRSASRSVASSRPWLSDALDAHQRGPCTPFGTVRAVGRALARTPSGHAVVAIVPEDLAGVGLAGEGRLLDEDALGRVDCR